METTIQCKQIGDKSVKTKGSVEMQGHGANASLGTVVHVRTNDVVSELLTDAVEAPYLL